MVTDLCTAVVELWNGLARERRLAEIDSLTDRQRRAILARSQELVKIYDFPDELSGWRRVMHMVRASPFLRGDKRGWKADFDFVVKPRHFTKIMDGCFEGGTGDVKRVRNL